MTTHLTSGNGTVSLTNPGTMVTSWIPAGHDEVIWSSALLEANPRAHGGIPICAPWFGKGRGHVSVPQSHGLVKYAPWRRVTESAWEITSAEVARIPGADRYPNDLTYRLDLSANESLTVALTISSPSTDVIVDQAFHTYFAISDIADLSIEGVQSAHPRHFVNEPTETRPGVITLNGATDSIYFGAAESRNPILLHDGNRSISITTDGAADVVIWNPGEENGAPSGRLAAGEWRQFVCVEVGNVQVNAVTVKAGQSHRMAMTLEVR